MSAAMDAELSPVKRALLEIRELRARLAVAESTAREPVAIVGAAMRLPGGIEDLEGLWSLLCSGRDAIVDVPADRWDVDALYGDVDAPGKTTTRRGGFVAGVDRFDAEFFGISPREAESMDPQQRLMLHASWHALEHAGMAPSSLRGSRTGVFFGVSNNDYGRMLFAHRDRIDPTFSVGNAASVVAGRVSYFLGLQGPSLAIDTACSSSLVALHLAVQSLRAGECDLALAGGVNLILSPEIDINFSKAGMMAADGRCKTFDAAADGYVRGEGCGVLVLQRLRDAPSERRVMALVRGSAVNQDGRSAGLTAPNGPAQEAVIRAAVAASGVQPRDIGYVEAHGTGTPLGDPIELQAIGSALGAGREVGDRIAVGSIKTQIGHLEAAAGVAGVLKAILALQRGEIPPHLNLHEPNPHVDWTSLPVVVPTTRTKWRPVGQRRLAGVSAFGFSGTNAHVVLEAAPAAPDASDGDTGARTLHVLPLSARDDQALAELAARYADRLATTRESTADVCATAARGRSHFAHRVSVRGSSCGQLSDALRAFAAGRAAPRTVAGKAAKPRVAFLFTGGGAQSPGMALGLAAHSAVFRETLARCARVLDPLLGRPLLDVLAGTDAAPLDRARFGQPALVAAEIALAALWRSWGIEPDAVLGHSLGEYAAAHVAGVLELDDALRIVVERTRHVETLGAAGAMATVFAAPAEVESALAQQDGTVCIAAYNGPSQVVVSGASDALDALCVAFEARGTRVARLRVDYASHSVLMDPILPAFEASLAGLRAAEPRIEFVSNLSGKPVGLDVLGTPSYWAHHLRAPVRFEQSVRHLLDSGCTHFVEIGPHPVLTGIGVECVAPGTGVWLPSLRREHDDWDTALESLQVLYADGAPIDWDGVDESAVRRRVELPLYPFRARRHWADWARQPATAEVDLAASAGSAVARALEAQAERGPIGVDLGGYAAKWASLGRLATAYAAQTLRGAGIFATAGERADVDAVRRRLGAAEHYRHLIGRWLQRLAEAGQLRAVAGPAYVADRPLADADLDAHWRDARHRLGDNAALLEYVRHCGDLLPAVLRGEESPLETLFPGGRYDIADALYRRSSTMRYINGLAASAVQAFVDARGPRPMHVLEIGAGSGATTAALLPCFVPDRTTYRYTDVSPFFFDRARAEHDGKRWVEFGEFDLDAELTDDAPRHDLVVAANAVHACRDLRAALRRLRRLVAPGGMLLLIESTVHLAWFDITTGLIEGWQHFADDLRDDQPLLDAPTWVEALRDAGFDVAEAWPRAGSAASELGQHVIVARVEGAVADAPAPVPAGDARPAESARRATEASMQWRRRIEAALPGERLDVTRDYVRACVMRVLKIDESAPPQRDQRLTDLGFDSLMAVQLRNALGTGLQLDKPLPATVMFDHPTIDALAVFLLERLELASPAAVAASSPAPEPASLDARAVAAMSDADIEALLISRMEAR